jgi:uncharacterized cysteine cluster protein YcgN (CxxCxxCC family)
MPLPIDQLPPPTLKPDFWKTKPLDQLDKEEWEALCDGCAKCCLHRLEDEDTQEIHFTNVCCRYLDQSSCRCSDYEHRSINVPDCVTVTLEILQTPYWLPLASQDPNSVFNSGNSVGGRVISELEADDLEFHMIDWIR